VAIVCSEQPKSVFATPEDRLRTFHSGKEARQVAARFSHQKKKQQQLTTAENKTTVYYEDAGYAACHLHKF
jgi:hypothetical protein